MNVLVGCEYSGIVRDAFEDEGWNAYSCDIISTESEQTRAAGKHIQADILRVIEHIEKYGDTVPFIDDVGNVFYLPKFDLFIAHPPCTYLSFAYTGKERYSIDRLQQKIYAYQFFLDLWAAPIEHICLENPMGYVHTGLLPYTQIVEPYYFGDPYKKRTCLWLKNLPKLVHTDTGLFGHGTSVKPTHTFVRGCSQNKGRRLPVLTKPFANGKDTAKFHTGIATAMAEQWTEYLINEIQTTKNK